MSDTFIYKGRECVRQLICFSADTTVHDIPKDAPIFGVNSEFDMNSDVRQLNSELHPSLMQSLVKFWMAEPSVKFRYLIMSMQKFIGQNSDEFNNNSEFRSSVTNLFVALFQQILVELGPSIMNKKPIGSLLKVSQVNGGSDLMKALKKLDIPYQKSLISQDSMHYVSQKITEDTTKEYQSVIEELIKLITIKLK